MSSAFSMPLLTRLVYLQMTTVTVKSPLPPTLSKVSVTYEEGGFLDTAAPTDGSSSKQVFRECVSNSNCVHIKEYHGTALHHILSITGFPDHQSGVWKYYKNPLTSFQGWPLYTCDLNRQQYLSRTHKVVTRVHKGQSSSWPCSQAKINTGIVTIRLDQYHNGVTCSAAIVLMGLHL